MVSCSSIPEMDSAEIVALKNLQIALQSRQKETLFIDAKNIITRDMIDSANAEVLFVELPSGQNGTLTKYPGEGVGTTWIGIDGASITFQNGMLIASRGMGDDLMGSSKIKIPDWELIDKEIKYHRDLSYLREDNKLFPSLIVVL